MRGLLLISAAAIAATAGVSHAQYEIARIADTADTYSSFSAPALSGANSVAYQASLSAGGQGIFRSQGGVATFLLATGPAFGAGVSVNNSDQVAYSVPLGQASAGIYVGSGYGVVTTTPIYTPPAGGPTPSNLGHPDISSSGTVVWNMRQPVTGGWGVYSGNGGAVTTVFAQPGSVFDMLTPSIAPGGSTVAWAWRDINQNWTLQNSNGTTIAGAATPYSEPPFSQGISPIQSVTINSGGDTAFTGDWAFGTEFFLNDDGVTGRETSGTWIPALNDDEELAGLLIAGSNKSIRFGVGNGSAGTVLVATGGLLDGGTIADLDFSPNGFNDLDSIAFKATFTDGRQGVYLARVPEPTSAGAVAIAGAAFAMRRRRR